MTIYDLEFYGAELRVEFQHVPSDHEVGFIGYCLIEHVWLNDEDWYSHKSRSNLLSDGAAYIIQGRVEAYISAQAQLSKAERRDRSRV